MRARAWQAKPPENTGSAGLASMWIHLNRVRSTFSKSLADTSGRFLHPKTGRKEKERGEGSQAPVLRWLGTPCLVAIPAAWQEAGKPAQGSEASAEPCPTLLRCPF